MLITRDREAIKQKIVKYFQQFSNGHIDGNTAINNDLGLVISEFPDICHFFYDEFRIELKGINGNAFFDDEIQNPIKAIVDFFTGANKLTKKPPLTINHLVEVVMTGRWIEPSDLLI